MADLIVSSTTNTREEMQQAIDMPDRGVSRGEVRAAVTPSKAETTPVVASGQPAAVETTPVVESPVTEVPAAVVPAVETVAATAEAAEPVAEPKESAVDGEELGRKARRRINRLVGEREHFKARNAVLEEEVARLRAAPTTTLPPAVPVTTPVAVAEPSVPATADMTMPDVATLRATAEAAIGPQPKADDFDTHEEYLTAISTHAARVGARMEVERGVVLDRQRREAENQQAIQAQREASTRQAVKRFDAGVMEAQTKYADFDQVMETAKELPLSPVMQRAIFREAPASDPVKGYDMAYYFASHQDEAKDISAMPPDEALEEIGAIRERLRREPPVVPATADTTTVAVASGQPVAAAAPVVTPVVSRTPKPITPVGARSTSTAPVNLESLPYPEFVALRNRQDAERLAARR